MKRHEKKPRTAAEVRYLAIRVCRNEARILRQRARATRGTAGAPTDEIQALEADNLANLLEAVL